MSADHKRAGAPVKRMLAALDFRPASCEADSMRICVFCGSSMGRNGAYRAAAEALGAEMARRGIGLVYGGASVGLMGAIADAVLARGGEAIGVLPEALTDLEIAHDGLSELRIVASMHERKAQMADLSDAFIALPGGIGTLEEAFEVWTWSQLSIHAKPIGLLNAAGYFDRLEAFLDHMVAEEFVKPVHREIMLTEDDPAALIDALKAAEIPTDRKWVDTLKR